MKKKPWIIRFLRWTLGSDDSLGIPDADFGLRLDMGILAMGRLAGPLEETRTEYAEAAKSGLDAAFEKGLIDYDDHCLGMENIKCWQVREELLMTCLVKYFAAPEVTQKEAANILKNLFCATLGEVRRMEADGEFPGCLRLFVRALLYDMDAGRYDTLNGVIDTVFQQ